MSLRYRCRMSPLVGLLVDDFAAVLAQHNRNAVRPINDQRALIIPTQITSELLHRWRTLWWSWISGFVVFAVTVSRFSVHRFSGSMVCVAVLRIVVAIRAGDMLRTRSARVCRAGLL